MLTLTPIPTVFTNVITWNYEDESEQRVHVSTVFHETREDAEAHSPHVLETWSKHNRLNVAVAVFEFAPIPF